MQSLPKMIVIAGTNASGKSSLGVALAKHYQGEIISADSRQVFAGLNLGSGKITETEMEGVPHHLLDVCAPGDFFSMADFQRMAYAAIDDILRRGKLPFLVGGTGLYIESVAEGYLLSGKMPDLAYRAELEKLDTQTLYAQLIKELPDIQVDAGNRNRVMRILERLRDGDYAPPRKEKRYRTLPLGVTWERAALGLRIDERLEKRLAQGMVEEVKKLLASGVSEAFLLGLGLEYRFITQYLTGDIKTHEEMTALLSTAIKQFAKRQMTWFRRNKEMHWLAMAEDPMGEAVRLIDGFLSTEQEPQMIP